MRWGLSKIKLITKTSTPSAYLDVTLCQWRSSFREGDPRSPSVPVRIPVFGVEHLPAMLFHPLRGLCRIVYTIAGVSPPWIRMSVPAIVRSSILIQFSAAGSALDFPREPGYIVDAITASGMPPATGTNPSGMVSRAYFFFHQKYWWEGMPLSSKTLLMEMPFSRLSAWISSICSRVSI